MFPASVVFEIYTYVQKGHIKTCAYAHDNPRKNRTSVTKFPKKHQKIYRI